MEKTMRISKRLDTFFGVMQKAILVALPIAAVIAVTLTVVSVFSPDTVIAQDFTSVTIGPLTIELAPELAPDNISILSYVWIAVVLGAISAAFIYYAFGIIRKILKPMTEGRPFDASVGQNIRKIGYASLVLGIVQNAGSMLETSAAVRAFSLTALSSGDAIQSITANYTLDLNFLLVFFALILMAHIFDYGAQLQQLSDETL